MFDKEAFRNLNCKKSGACWYMDFVDNLKLDEEDMLRICRKCIFYKGGFE